MDSRSRGTTPLDPSAALAERHALGEGPSEPQSAIEHQAALDATLFRSARDPYEVVLELEAGQLRFLEETREP